jgi:DedD protein
VDPNLKRRLMIAVIIIALVVIFVPIPFGRHEDTPPNRIEAIPPAPQEATIQPADSVQAKRIDNGFHASSNASASNASDEANTSAASLASKFSAQNAMTEKAETPTASSPATPSPSTRAVTPTQSSAQASKVSKAPTKKPIQNIHLNTKVYVAPILATPSVKTKAATTHLTKQVPSKILKPKSVTQPKPAAKTKSTIKPKAITHKTVTPQKKSLTSFNHKPLVITSSDLQNGPPVVNIRNYDISSSNAVKASSAIAPSPKVQVRHLKLAKQADHAWVVQLGSFVDPKRTEMVVKELQKEGFAAFSYSEEVKGKIAHRVYVGPFTNAAKAKSALNAVDKKYKMSGYIHTFDATDLH